MLRFPFETPHVVSCIIHVIKISVRSLRGFVGEIFCRSTSGVPREPINSANSNCCFFNSTIASGDSGADFSAIPGDVSRTEKFTAKISIQIAANPAHALG